MRTDKELLEDYINLKYSDVPDEYMTNEVIESISKTLGFATYAYQIRMSELINTFGNGFFPKLVYRLSQILK